MDTVVRPASGAKDYAAVALLIDEYVGWMRRRYRDDERFIVDVLDQQTFTAELANLSTIYGPPNGRAFLAAASGEFHGCGAYRRLDDDACEMKRVFVPDRFRGAGLGRKLCQAIIDAAGAAGYACIQLDSLHRMHEAATLYRSFGFRECAPYRRYPDPLMPYIVFMELTL